MAIPITIKAGAYESSTRVISNSFTGFAYFSRSGKELTQYTPGESTLSRSLLYLGPAQLDA